MAKHLVARNCTFVLIFIAAHALSCGSDQRAKVTRLTASGATWGADKLVPETAAAIQEACKDPKGALDVGLSVAECAMIMAGSSVRESSWNAQKSCEAWGNPSDPCCGLTQSRRSDARAVGLSCDPNALTSEGYKCNVLTGLRNIGCKANDGRDCLPFGSDGSLYIGVKKHLGTNTANLPSYVQDMKDIYHRADIRALLVGNGAALREWQNLFYESVEGRQSTFPRVQGQWTQSPVTAEQQ